MLESQGPENLFQNFEGEEWLVARRVLSEKRWNTSAEVRQCGYQGCGALTVSLLMENGQELGPGDFCGLTAFINLNDDSILKGQDAGRLLRSFRDSRNNLSNSHFHDMILIQMCRK